MRELLAPERTSRLGPRTRSYDRPRRAPRNDSPAHAPRTEWIPPIVVFFAAIAAWQSSIEMFNIQKFLLPKPWAIVSAFWTQRTASGAQAGSRSRRRSAASRSAGARDPLCAVVLARFRRVGAALMPIAIAANAIPIIAFAPIFNVWFDPLSPPSKMAIAGVLCFFPVMVNTLRGAHVGASSQIELMRSYAASELQIFRRVRVPTALPFLFSALKVATVLAMIGAIVSDYFGTFGSLGITIKNSVSLFDFETAWAAILVASILGVALYVVVSLAERFALQWDPTRQERELHDQERNRTRARLPAVVAAAVAAGLGMSRTSGAEAHQGDAAAQVGHAGAVRRLLRRGREGLLQGGGPRRDAEGRRPDITPEQVVVGGQAEFGLDWLPNLFATREKGGKIVSIAQVFARSGMTELTWKTSGINTIAKMRGKKVGVWCCGNQPELFAALNKNGINPANKSEVTIVNQPFDMDLFLQHKIDAAAAMTYNELAQVLETKNPKTGKLYTLADLNVFKMASPQVGTGMLEDNVFTTEKYLNDASHQTTIVNFLKASFQGWIYCRSHVSDCTETSC